jgi:hypothetical protein
MAQTELKRIEQAIRLSMEKTPSLGCGCDTIYGGDAAVEGDWVAIQTLDHSLGNTTLLEETVVDWYRGTTGVMDIPMAFKNSSATNNSDIFWGNFKSIKIDQGKLLAYRRCK